MHVHRSEVEWVVQAPAKLNLFFEVRAKRDDGYHEIETLMCPVGLYDTVYFREVYFREAARGHVELICHRADGAGHPARAPATVLPQDCSNLVVRAVELLREAAGIDAGARMRLVKRIPIAAGLGGGSSDAAAALVAANRAWGLHWSAEQLARIAARVGSDVPFFLAGGPAVCRGRGEDVAPVAAPAGLPYVVVHPPEGLSTPAVYGACVAYGRAEGLPALVGALARGNLKQIGRRLFNRLEPAAARLSPWIERLQREFSGLDCLGYGMSGSGTSYFGLCRHARHARRVADRLQARRIGRAFAVQSCR